MANKKFVTKNGALTNNLQFVDVIGSATQSITLSLDSLGTLSFDGINGQLFSVTDNMSGTIFSVNDISGIPSIEVLDDGTTRLAEFAGNVLIGTNADDGANKLQVSGNTELTGNTNITGDFTVMGNTSLAGEFTVTDTGTTAITGTLSFKNNDNDYSALQVFTSGGGLSLNSHVTGHGYVTATNALQAVSYNSTNGSSIWLGNGSRFKLTNNAFTETYIMVDTAGLVGIGTATPTQKLDVAGNIAVSGTVDGRDIAADGAKLDGIEAGATADQTGAEIKSLYEANLNTNAYTDADKALVASALQSETVTSLSLVGNILTYTDENGTPVNHDLSIYLDDTNLSRITSGVYNAQTQSLIFTRDDLSTFSVDASMFFDDTNLVTSVDNLTGAVDLSTRYLGISAKAADSDLLDGLDSTQFLRSDVDDSSSAKLNVHTLTSIKTESTIQENHIKSLSTAVSDTLDANWRGRAVFGSENTTLLMGVYKNYATLGAHSWTSASADSGAAWQDLYLNPDGSKGVYVGGTAFNPASTILAILNSTGKVGIKNIAPTEALDVTGNIAVSGTVDGRDIAVDGAKLDGIEAGATADQTGAEIKSLYEAELDTNAYTDAEKAKLLGIEAGATADQTKSDIDALGINAATLDSLDSTQFLRSDTNDIMTGKLTVQNLDFSNPGLGSTSKINFLKNSDTASIEVTEVTSDATEFAFRMSDNPQSSNDKFYWQINSYTGGQGNWRPLEFKGLVSNITALNTNYNSKVTIAENPFYTDGVNKNAYLKYLGTEGNISINVSGNTITGSRSEMILRVNALLDVDVYSNAPIANVLNASATPILTLTPSGLAQSIGNGNTCVFPTTGLVEGQMWQFSIYPGGGLVTDIGEQYYHSGNLSKAVIDALVIDAATLDGIDSTQFLRSDVPNSSVAETLEFFSNAVTATLITGRDAGQYIELKTTDNFGYLTYYQDETTGLDHSFIFDINTLTDGNPIFIFNKPVDVQGNITTTGTVDGRDIATDGAKLDGIEAGATADQTKADIDALGIDAATLDGIDSTGFSLTSHNHTGIYALLNGSTATNFATLDLTVQGNLTVNGTTTTINSATINTQEKNITLGNVTTPTDITADGGGITLKGTSDKTITWISAKSAWESNQLISIKTSAPAIALEDTSLANSLAAMSIGSGDLYLWAPDLVGAGNIVLKGYGNTNLAGDLLIYKNNVLNTVYHSGNFGKTEIDALAVDAGTLDGLDSTQFVRSDVNDTISGDLNFSSTNSNFPSHFYHNLFGGTNVYDHAYPSGYAHSSGITRFTWRASDGISGFKAMEFTGVGNLTVPNAIFEGGTSLELKYLGIGAKAADSNLLDGFDSTYFEPSFVKNTGFNKNFGSAAGTVSEGNHTHTDLTNATNVNTASTIVKRDTNGDFNAGNVNAETALNLGSTQQASVVYNTTQNSIDFIIN